MNAETFIKREEGLRLEVYLCPAGKLSIGYGHTGDDVHPGMVITLEQAEALLEKDIATARKGLSYLVKVPLTPGQEAALISFVFNEGFGKLASSTLLSLLNAGNYPAASDQFPLWDKYHKDGVLVTSGALKERRERERKVFLGEA